MTEGHNKRREELREIFAAALAAVAPDAAVTRHVHLAAGGRRLEAGGRSWDLDRGSVRVVGAGKGAAPMAQALEKLLGAGLSPEDALRLYLKGDPALLGDVEAVAEDSLAHEEAKEADDPIRTAHILRERWREEQLFLTVNHPGRVLLFHVAEELLRLLGLGPLPESVRDAYVHPQDEFWLPLHPALGRRLGLPFANRERRYPVFGASLTHQEYTAAYLSCRAHGVCDLVGFLRAMGEDAAGRRPSPALPAKDA